MSVVDSQRSVSKSFTSTNRVNEKDFMQEISAKARQTISRTLHAETTRIDMINKLENKHKRQSKRHSSASSARKSEVEAEIPVKQQLINRYEDKIRRIAEKKAKAAEAEKAKAREWRKLLRLQTKRTELDHESDKQRQKLRAVKTAREQRNFKSWRDQVEAEEVEEIDARIQSFEERMSSHKSRYAQSVRSLTGKTTEKLKKVREVTVAQEQQRQAEAEERFVKYLRKHTMVEMKRSKLNDQQASKREEKVKLLRDKLTRVKSKAEENQKQVQTKLKVLEIKAETSNELLNRKASEWKRQLEMRIEAHKLKEMDSKDLSLRSKRVASNKRSQILRKHLEAQLRIEALKHNRDHSSLLKRDLEIKAMIERERRPRRVKSHPEIPRVSPLEESNAEVRRLRGCIIEHELALA
eukprot:CAMPEP_0204915128 /NCGR_PEP_ID=MMETSP1397-20131031/13159_1 /ASSEMBLY_ACC=CAM_ASM_000891 /TAXON_ID=49980 /ORGANISM="Climacostomum Climacostomum virens, Strain Stock W-24" /LENGTH=409 /DNA_ID=CAMNT_0052087033 /DNA_START=206 /DNA_END=1431 /DNA_ORIENTATION=-